MAAEKERNPGSSSAEIGKYLDILAKDPNSRVFAPLAEAYRKAGFCDDAIEIALEGLKSHPNYLGGRVALGRAYFEKNQLAEAAAEMQKVAKSAPDNIIAHKVLGQIADRQNNLPAAEKAFKMVLLLDPRDAEAQQFIANLAGTVTTAALPVQLAQTMPELQSPLPRPVDFPPPPGVPAPPAFAPTPPVPPPPLPGPVSPAPLPFEEIQAIGDIDLQADDIFGGQPTAPDDGMELEVFARELRKGDPEPAAAQPSLPEPELELAPELELELEPAPAPVVAADDEDSPFEVFTRDRGTRAAPPVKVERVGGTGPRELDIETTGYNPPDEFTPDGVVVPLLSPDDELSRVDLTQELDFGSLSDVSPSPVAPAPEAGPAPEQETKPEPATALALEPESELKAELGPEPELKAELGPEPELNAEPGPELVIEQELELDPELEPEWELELKAELEAELVIEQELELEPKLVIEQELELEPVLEPEPEPILELRAEPHSELETEPESIPEIDLEVDLASDLEPAEYTPPGRGVFDTETLASIYTSQGFYVRAAEIYQRLIAQRPDDPGLRGKLEGVLALERQESGIEEPVAAAAAAVARFSSPAPPVPVAAEPAGAVRAGPDQAINQLYTLLDAFKGGRPR